MLYTKHQYDTSDRITAQSWQIGNEAFSESYTYDEDDGTLQGMNIGTEAIAFTYNGLKQLTKRTSPKVDTAYEYRVLDAEEKTVSSQIASMQYLKAGTTEELLPTLSYTYDALGNITRLQSGTATAAEYTYDAQNQLTKEVLPSQTSEYVYDTYGNIRSKIITDSENASESYTFSYEDTEWLDKLTQVTYTDKNGSTTSQSLIYDAIGNPLSYFNGKNSWTFTWKNGRELAAATDGSTAITYTYDADGIRESKTVDGVEHKYITLDDKVIRENYGTTTIDYLYDDQGRAYKLIIDENGTTYIGYFVLNQQGDTIALLDEAGAVAVQYEYDAWGKEIGHSTTGTAGSKLYEYNALKYRGYYYDAETGFYYVSSRYYDPGVGRFISADDADVLSIEADSLLHYNLYAYCWNNPVNMADESGYLPWFVTAAAAGALADSILYLVSSAIRGKRVTWSGIGKAALTGALSSVAVGAIGRAIRTAINAGKFAKAGIRIINKKYANKAFKLTGKLAEKYGKSIKFNRYGFPNFGKYAKYTTKIKGLTGNYAKDAAMANARVGLRSTPKGFTWHHVEDGLTMMLIPTDLHNAVRHTGGVALIRKLLNSI